MYAICIYVFIHACMYNVCRNKIRVCRCMYLCMHASIYVCIIHMFNIIIIYAWIYTMHTPESVNACSAHQFAYDTQDFAHYPASASPSLAAKVLEANAALDLWMSSNICTLIRRKGGWVGGWMEKEMKGRKEGKKNDKWTGRQTG